MPKSYSIRFLLEDASAMAAFKRGNAEMAKMERTALKTATAVEKAVVASANAQQAAVARVAAAVQQAASAQTQLTAAAKKGAKDRKQAADDESVHIDFGLHKLQVSGIKYQDGLTKAARKAADARKKAADDEAAFRQRTFDKAATDEHNRALREAKKQESAALGPLGRLAQVQRRYLDEQELRAAAYNRLVDVHQQKRIRGYLQEMGAENESFVEAIGHATGLQGALTKVGAAMLAVDVGGKVIGAIVENFRNAEKSAYDAAQMVQGYREALLELAALKGQLGRTSETMSQEVGFRAVTLQSAEDSRRFQEAALGVGEAGVDKPGAEKLISPEEFRKAMEFGGAFQAVERGSAETHGSLVGLIPQLLGRRTTGEEVARTEAQLYKIFQPGGASFTSLTGQYAKLAPLITSKSYDPMQAAALLSAFSTTNREGAGQEVEQFTRATLGGIDRTGKPRVKGGEPRGDYYRSLGIDEAFLKATKPQDMAFAIADKVTADVVAREAEAKARGEEFNRRVYLEHKGYGNQEDTNALLHYMGLKESGLLGKTFMPLAAPGAMPTLQEARAGVVQAQNVEPALQARKGELADQLANISVGAGKQEYIQNLQRLAFARLKARGEVHGEYGEQVQNAPFYDPMRWFTGFRDETEMEAQRMLREEALRVGVTPKIPYKVNPTTGRIEGERFMGHEAMYQLARQIQAAGGSGVPGLAPLVGTAQTQLGQSAAWEGRPVADNTKAMIDLKEAVDRNNALLKRRQNEQPPAATPAALPRGAPVAGPMR